MDQPFLKLLLEAPAIGALIFVYWTQSKRIEALSESVNKMADAVSKQSGILLGLTRGGDE